MQKGNGITSEITHRSSPVSRLLTLLLVAGCVLTASPLRALDSTAFAAGISIFKHPSGMFTLSIPEKWGTGTSFSYNPNVLTFKLSITAVLTVSISKNLNLPPELPMKIVAFMFTDESPISEPVREKGNHWNSIRQDFEKNIDGKTMVWLAKFYGFKSNVIAITLSDTKENIEQHRALFNEVTGSIRFDGQ